MEIQITEWQYKDEMTEDSMYDALYPLSKISGKEKNGVQIGVRMFPKKIWIVKAFGKEVDDVYKE